MDSQLKMLGMTKGPKLDPRLKIARITEGGFSFREGFLFLSTGQCLKEEIQVFTVQIHTNPTLPPLSPGFPKQTAVKEYHQAA